MSSGHDTMGGLNGHFIHADLEKMIGILLLFEIIGKEYCMATFFATI